MRRQLQNTADRMPSLRGIVRGVRAAVIILSCLAGLLICGIAGLFIYYSKDLPSVAPLKTTDGVRSLLASGLHEEQLNQVILIPSDSIPPSVEKAVIAVSSWPEEFRIKLLAPSGTILSNELAKLLLNAETEPRTNRMARQSVLKLKIEYSLSLKEMISAWLATEYFGKGVYGATAASALYFNKPLAELNVCEAAMLAAITHAPSSANPIAFPDRAKERQQEVLNNMVKLGLVSELDIEHCAREA